MARSTVSALRVSSAAQRGQAAAAHRCCMQQNLTHAEADALASCALCPLAVANTWGLVHFAM